MRMGRVLARKAVWAPKITAMKGMKQMKALDRERELERGSVCGS